LKLKPQIRKSFKFCLFTPKDIRGHPTDFLMLYRSSFSGNERD
jgi:hypothetical protein